jgi:hypothetical protein
VSKLYVSLFGMVLLFAAAMSFATLAVYEDQWWWGVVAAVILLALAAAGGAVVPSSLRSLSGGRLRTAKTALQLLGSVCGLLFFTMALITWSLGKRSVGAGSGYTTLGLLIFLGFAGVGLQGALAMVGYFLYVRNEAIVIPARRERSEPAPGHDASRFTSPPPVEVPVH